MPVYKIEQEMPYDELLGWMHYFEARPEGWREDQRTYLVLRALGLKEKAEKIFPTLDAIKKEEYQQRNKLRKKLSDFMKLSNNPLQADLSRKELFDDPD